MTQHALIYVASFGGAAILVLAFTPVARVFAHRHGMVDHPGGQAWKWHQEPTAYLGGVVIALAVPVVALAAHQGDAARVAAILGGALACAAVGAYDDWRPLGVIAKLVPPLVGAVVLWIAGVRVAFTGVVPLDLALEVLWVVAVTHAFNVIDNLDGVAVGLAGLAAAGAFGVALLRGDAGLAVMAIAVAGACLGFLPFNYRPATVFLGDAGTLFLGFTMASISLAIALPGATQLTRGVVPTLLVAVPLLNMALVVTARLIAKRPVMVGARDGTAHRLVALGLTRSQATVVFWTAGAVLAAAAVLVAWAGVQAELAAGISIVLMGIAFLWGFHRIEVVLEPARQAIADQEAAEESPPQLAVDPQAAAGSPTPQTVESGYRFVPQGSEPLASDWGRRRRT